MAGPTISPVMIRPDAPSRIGRSSACDTLLPDASVSRNHASLWFDAGQWLIEDGGSRHGTFVNGVRLEPSAPAPLRHGDRLALGPWIFAVVLDDGGSRSLRTTALRDVGTQRVERLTPESTGAIARQRLETLLDFAGRITGAADIDELADAVVSALIHGAGFPRAALIRESGRDQIEVIAARTREGNADPEALDFSRSLVRQAAEGEIVQLIDEEMPSHGQSIASLGICAAICAPVKTGEEIEAFLYLDARHDERAAPADAELFCRGVARLCGLAMGNLERRELEARRKSLEADLLAARAAQEVLIPPDRGAVGCVRYALRTTAGRLVAGDLVDVFALDDGRVAVALGDIAGKGVGAAILMTFTQARLAATLARTGNVAAAVQEVSDAVAERWPESQFVTLWTGVFDASQGRLEFVDAGHGHWAHKPNGAPAARAPGEGFMIAGVTPDEKYHAETLAVAPGDRVVIVSDGVIEQRGPSGEQFGMERFLEALRESESAHDDVVRVSTALETFSDGARLADDATILSVEVCEAG